jgi:hypothetical protein
MPADGKPFTLEIEAPANGKVGKAVVTALDTDRKVITTDTANLTSATERKGLAKRLAGKLARGADEVQAKVEAVWNDAVTQRRRMLEQAKAGSPEAVAVESIALLDSSPLAIRRPLALVGGAAYAAAWVSMQRTKSRSVDPATGLVTNHDPPLVSAEDVLLIVTDDGELYTDAALPDARPLAELGLVVRLPATPPPERGWSGAGVKRYLAGERPDPADVFARVTAAVDRFIDFARSLAPQEQMCELTACYIVASYLLDALNVTGYLWPNGERGTGKTSYLQMLAELSYLGQLILAGSSYACLRDMADYGATLAFDDAEAVMDVKRTDPDKRTLLLAGSRRGATVAVKELDADGKRWVTRHVNTFCQRAFSAIRLPDDTLGSRSIIIPLVRSGDEQRAKANPLDPQDWPCDRRRLVDDLWAIGLAHLPELSAHDRQAAATAKLMGRSLDAWRPILAVAHWLQEQHGIDGLFDRLEALSVKYDGQERGEYEDGDTARVLFRVLIALPEETEGGVKIKPGDVAKAMNEIAAEDHLGEPGEDYTNPKRVGQLLKRQRFKRPSGRSSKGKLWTATRQEIVQAASAFGVKGDDGGDGPNEGSEPAESGPDEVPF